MIEQRIFGAFPDGKLLRSFRITNQAGESAELLEYGATLNAICVKDRDGVTGNVVFRAGNMEELLAPSAKRGSVIGRCGNRIKGGRCVLDGKEVQLETNVKGNLLHSGSANYAHRLFRGKELSEQSVSFSYLDTGGAGFDTEVEVKITYTFDDDHALTIEYELIPKDTTVLSPTNHAYFHMDGTGSVTEHEMWIDAEEVAAKDDTGAPTGEVFQVKGTPFDFTETRTIGEGIRILKERRPSAPFFDDYYLVNQCGVMKNAAEIYSPVSGRRMTVETDMPCVILFIKGRKRDGAFTDPEAVCLETQFVPNAVNCPQFDSPVFRKGEVFRSRTVYRFSTDTAQ